MTRVLITGASGFIGNHLVPRLAKDHTVRCAVRAFGTSSADWGAQCEIAVVGDIGPSTRWEDALHGVDLVVHLAALAHKNSPDPEQLERVNVEGLRQLVNACEISGVSRIVLLSSIGVLGNKTGQESFTEESPPCPHDLYSRSKLKGEELLREKSGQSALEFVIIRPPLVYGPQAPGNFGRVVGIVKRGIPLPFAGLQNRRSLISVANLVDFIALAVAHPNAANETFVICDGEDVSTPQLFSAIAKACGKRPRVFYVPLPILKLAFAGIGKADYFIRLCESLKVDSTYARERLGWQPPQSLEEGLRQACV
ncbi:NAD-dependent epimerase/dehydratase family protein [Lentisalinibacter salinarum]|uniref:NAD-dependent epimerase/dehydratase family protein n=1 Tax=Lentisalinibacter salinarum TaxID=2992239 RepID=UPI00386ABBB9